MVTTNQNTKAWRSRPWAHTLEQAINSAKVQNISAPTRPRPNLFAAILCPYLSFCPKKESSVPINRGSAFWNPLIPSMHTPKPDLHLQNTELKVVASSCLIFQHDDRRTDSVVTMRSASGRSTRSCRSACLTLFHKERTRSHSFAQPSKTKVGKEGVLQKVLVLGPCGLLRNCIRLPIEVSTRWIFSTPGLTPGRVESTGQQTPRAWFDRPP